jgi:hypothetical protein
MAQPLVKEEVHELVDSLPEGATWDDLRYLIYVRTEIEKGRLSAREGKGKSNNEIRAKFGLEPLP